MFVRLTLTVVGIFGAPLWYNLFGGIFGSSFGTIFWILRDPCYRGRCRGSLGKVLPFKLKPRQGEDLNVQNLKCTKY